MDYSAFRDPYQTPGGLNFTLWSASWGSYCPAVTASEWDQRTDTAPYCSQVSTQFALLEVPIRALTETARPGPADGDRPEQSAEAIGEFIDFDQE